MLYVIAVSTHIGTPPDPGFFEWVYDEKHYAVGQSEIARRSGLWDLLALARPDRPLETDRLSDAFGELLNEAVDTLLDDPLLEDYSLQLI